MRTLKLKKTGFTYKKGSRIKKNNYMVLIGSLVGGYVTYNFIFSRYECKVQGRILCTGHDFNDLRANIKASFDIK